MKDNNIWFYDWSRHKMQLWNEGNLIKEHDCKNPKLEYRILKNAWAGYDCIVMGIDIHKTFVATQYILLTFQVPCKAQCILASPMDEFNPVFDSHRTEWPNLLYANQVPLNNLDTLPNPKWTMSGMNLQNHNNTIKIKPHLMKILKKLGIGKI
jgi:hypothetical protein